MQDTHTSLTAPVAFERRRYQRLPLELECRVSCLFPGQAASDGHTVNISRVGVLVKLNAPGAAEKIPPLGAPVLVEIHLPGRRGLRCHGRVTRIEAGAGLVPAIAVAVERMNFASVAALGQGAKP